MFVKITLFPKTVKHSLELYLVDSKSTTNILHFLQSWNSELNSNEIQISKK